MSDKLDWLNQHLTLLRYQRSGDTVALENYKATPPITELIAKYPASEDLLHQMDNASMNKEGCEFLAYAMHRRAAVWWGYLCLISLMKELKKKPAVERDISEIGKPKPMPVPDWAKEPPEDNPAEIVKNLRDTQEKLRGFIKEMKAQIPPEIQKKVDDAWAVAQEEFKKTHGVTLDELKEQVLAKARESKSGMTFDLDMNSPLFKAAEELKQTIEQSRQNTINVVKSALPPKFPELQKKQKDEAMMAVYRWVVAPDEINAQKAMDCGNACPDTPAGLLALAAFWAYGNLTPTGAQVIPTPAGLAANGLTSVLLQCALHSGGTRSFSERYDHYLGLGLQVASGRETWSDALNENGALHQHLEEIPGTPEKSSVNNAYSRWKPTIPEL